MHVLWEFEKIICMIVDYGEVGASTIEDTVVDT